MTEDPYRALERAFIDTYSTLRGRETPSFKIEFYAYSGLRHTIRSRSGRVLIRISDICRTAPIEILCALVTVLLYRLFRRKPPAKQLKMYRSFAQSDPVRAQTTSIRAERSRKKLRSPQGEVFDLMALFRNLNGEYFENRLQVDRVGWSLRRSRRTLGHYDPAHRTITLSRWLDHPLVPQYVVEYVLYHEMLHALLEEESHEGKRRIHHRRFRIAERNFSRYEAARDFIRSHL